MQRSTVLQWPRTSLRRLIKPDTYQSGGACLLLWSLLALQVWELVFNYKQGSPKKLVNQEGGSRSHVTCFKQPRLEVEEARFEIRHFVSKGDTIHPSEVRNYKPGDIRVRTAYTVAPFYILSWAGRAPIINVPPMTQIQE